MDDLERKQLEFNLDDIMKEFGSSDETVAQEKIEEDVRLWDGVIPTEPAPALPVEDTVRLDDITRAVKRMEEVSDATVRFAPVGGEEEEETPFVMPTPEEKV